MQTTINSTDLLKYILPEGIFNYFTLTKVEEQDGKLHFYLEEIHTIPEELNTRRLESNGFHKESVIKDFPLRGKPTYLHVRRRRWLDLDSKEVVSRNWEAVAKGTGYTHDLAFFFNELIEFLPHYRTFSGKDFSSCRR